MISFQRNLLLQKMCPFSGEPCEGYIFFFWGGGWGAVYTKKTQYIAFLRQFGVG